MGREGHVPKIFAKIHPKYKTPYVSTIIVALITAPIVYVESLQDLTSIVNFGALTAYVLLLVSLTYLFVKSEKKILYAIMPVVGLIVTLLIWWGLDINAKIVGFTWLVLGIIYLAYITKGFKIKTRLPV